MRIVVWGFLVLVCLLADARAQTPESRGTVGGTVVAGRTWDDEGAALGPVRQSVDVSRLASIRTNEYRRIDRLAVARPQRWLLRSRRTNDVPGRLRRSAFRTQAVRPYLLGGLHLASHSGSTMFDGVRTERDSTGFGFHFGGGIAFRIGQRFELGPEARFYMIQPDNDLPIPAMAYLDRFSVGLRFCFASDLRTTVSLESLRESAAAGDVASPVRTRRPTQSAAVRSRQVP